MCVLFRDQIRVIYFDFFNVCKFLQSVFGIFTRLFRLVPNLYMQVNLSILSLATYS